MLIFDASFLCVPEFRLEKQMQSGLQPGKSSSECQTLDRQGLQAMSLCRRCATIAARHLQLCSLLSSHQPQQPKLLG